MFKTDKADWLRSSSLTQRSNWVKITHTEEFIQKKYKNSLNKSSLIWVKFVQTVNLYAELNRVTNSIYSVFNHFGQKY